MTRAFALGALLALTACAVPPPDGAPPAPAAQLTPAQPLPAPQAAPIPPPPIMAEPQPVPPPPPPPPQIVVLPPAPPPPPTLNPTDLLGKGRTDVVALLGRPDSARTEAGAEVLLYQGEGCVLFVFLYVQAGGGAPRIDHVELGPRARDTTRDGTCLSGLVQRAALARG